MKKEMGNIGGGKLYLKIRIALGERLQVEER